MPPVLEYSEMVCRIDGGKSLGKGPAIAAYAAFSVARYSGVYSDLQVFSPLTLTLSQRLVMQIKIYNL